MPDGAMRQARLGPLDDPLDALADKLKERLPQLF